MCSIGTISNEMYGKCYNSGHIFSSDEKLGSFLEVNSSGVHLLVKKITSLRLTVI